MKAVFTPTWLKHLVVCFAVILGASIGDPAVADEAAVRCAAIAAAPPPGVQVNTTEVVTDREDLPAFCRVAGVIAPSVGFEMRLPVENWNGRFLMSGCGAFCGSVDADRKGYANSINYALRRGYAATTTDSGHQSSRTDTSWAYNNPQAEQLYAHGWVPLAAAASRAILEAFYSERERYAYFSGCSNGGRTALKVAQLYPDLFDGIASGAPGINATYAAGVLGVFFDRTLVDKQGQLILRADKVPLLSQAVRDRCDHLDGLIDGIISDPARCDFKPESLRCADDSDTTGCLVKAELEQLEALYAGVTDSQGTSIYFGLPLGSEPYWSRWLLGATAEGKPHVTDLGTNFLRYLGFEQDPGPDYHSSEFDLDQDIPKLAATGELFNATDPDLSELQQSGGKLLMYHGLADPLTFPQESTRYYESVVKQMKPATPLDDFYRLFLIPGADHCWGVTGLAPDLFDPLQVLEQWVEQGQAPDNIEAVQHAGVGSAEGTGTILRTRPLCPYPQQARYKGAGSTFAADSFSCVLPE